MFSRLTPRGSEPGRPLPRRGPGRRRCGIGVPVPLLALLAFVVATALAPRPAAAQGYGQNKVQYATLDWSVIETPHLRLHYYAQEESLARHLAAFAESVCVEYDRRFRITKKPVPFLLYSAHQLFQQTNATPDFISEGVGGLTELIKGRVLLPHTGSWARLRWVTRHELTHAYQLEKVATVMHAHHKTQTYAPPLWFTEGFAEYCGTTWDADAEGLMRDAMTSGEAPPLTHSESITGTVLMYKEGQSFLTFLGARYGDARIFDLFDNWYRAEDFETLFKIVFGEPLADLDAQWYAAERRHYYPLAGTADPVSDVAQRLTPRAVYSLGPRVLPPAAPGDTALRFCYFSASESAIDLILNEPRPHGRRRDVKVLRGGTTPQFESFHLFENRPGVSPSGRIVVSSKRGASDAIYVVDPRRRRVERRLAFPTLVAISDPVLVPGDTACVFSAQDQGGRRDLYRARWGGRRVELDRLTDDDFDDLEPDLSPDGRWVAFASDRGDRGGSYSLFRLSLADGTIEMLSDPAHGDDRQPVYSPDGAWLAFRSTRGGISELWVRHAERDSTARRVTRLLGPVYDPDWLPGGKGLLFTGERAIHFYVYRLAFDPDTLAAEPETGGPRTPVLPTVATDAEPSRYQRRLSFDLATNTIGIDPGLSYAGGGGELALSDVLGNEQLDLLVANDSERFGSFWDGFEAGLTYVNRSQRLNWGLGLFRLTEVYDVDLDIVRRERRVGLLGLASYPFSRFTRVDVSVLVRYARDHLLRNGESENANLMSQYVALVTDNSRWTELGPSAGRRTYLSAGFTRDLSSGAGDFTSLLADVRQYALPFPHLAFAVRAQAQSSFGQDAQRYYLGGWASIRGYERRALSGTQTVLLQSEARFPLVRGLTLAVPALWTFPTIGGAVFLDGAWTWFTFADHPLTLGELLGNAATFQAGSTGVSFYIGGGYYPAFRWDYAWVTESFHRFSPRPRTQFSLAYNF